MSKKKKLIPMHELPRDTIIEVGHLDLQDSNTKEKVREVKFLNMDGHLGICEHNGSSFLMFANVEVYIKEVKDG